MMGGGGGGRLLPVQINGGGGLSGSGDGGIGGGSGGGGSAGGSGGGTFAGDGGMSRMVQNDQLTAMLMMFQEVSYHWLELRAVRSGCRFESDDLYELSRAFNNETIVHLPVLPLGDELKLTLFTGSVQLRTLLQERQDAARSSSSAPGTSWLDALIRCLPGGGDYEQYARRGMSESSSALRKASQRGKRLLGRELQPRLSHARTAFETNPLTCPLQTRPDPLPFPTWPWAAGPGGRGYTRL